jgi:hypothetical protein
VVDTVLIDQEMIYMPRHGNDRFLLRFKHNLNECKLGLLRQRPLSARYISDFLFKILTANFSQV